MAFQLLAVSAFVAARHRSWQQLRDEPVDFVVEFRRFLSRPRDDERRARLVDQDAVHLVDNREGVAPLHVVGQFELHVVAQVVETELVVGAVRDVAGIGLLAFLVVQLMLDHADAHAEKPVDASHPFRVAPGQVVVDRHDVDALAGQGVQVRGQCGHQRLALARLHLGDIPAVQHDAADQLHIKVPHVQRAAGGFPHHGEGIDEQTVERIALGEAFAQRRGLSAQLRVALRPHCGFTCVDFAHKGRQRLERAFVLGAENLREEGIQHVCVDDTSGITRF